MAGDSKIGWTDKVWNPVTGCSQVSPGCDNCYAKTLAENPRYKAGFPNGFDVQPRPKVMNSPKGWKKPQRIFVNSMSDLFHIEVPDDYIVEVWDVMLAADHHTFQLLTKRPHRMAEKIKTLGLQLPPHIWLGTSVEEQRFAANRLPALASISSPSRWVSAEPLLEKVSLVEWLRTGELNWVVCGGESGKDRRPFEHEWARELRDECHQYNVPFYFKQGSAFYPGKDRELEGRTWDGFPNGFPQEQN